MIELGRVYGLTGLELFRHVIFPGALPSILVGVRYALGVTWLTLVVAETIAASSGIGYMTMNAREFLQTDVVVLGILIYALLGKLADSATRWLEKRCLAWHPAFTAPHSGDCMTECTAQQQLWTSEGSQTGVEVRVSDLGKRFGSRAVLTGVNLEILPGEFVAIVGQSGCGKSTLLRLIAGLDAPSQGRIEVAGQPVTRQVVESRILFQDSRLLPWRSVIENVGIGRRGNWKPAGLEALEQVGLSSRAQDWPAVLSGGQRQRVALARALVSHPRLLLLDEPLGALDALTRLDMQRLIEDVWGRQRFTAVLVTHDVGEAVTLADRVVVLQRGAATAIHRIDIPTPAPSGRSGFERDGR